MRETYKFPPVEEGHKKPTLILYIKCERKGEREGEIKCRCREPEFDWGVL